MKKFTNIPLKRLLGFFSVLTFIAFLTNVEALIFGGSAGFIPVFVSFLWTGAALVLLLLPFSKRNTIFDCATGVYSLWLTAFGVWCLLDNLPGTAFAESLFPYASSLVLGTPYTGVLNVIKSIASSLLPNINTDAVVWSVLSVIGVFGIVFSAVSLIKRHSPAKNPLQQAAA